MCSLHIVHHTKGTCCKSRTARLRWHRLQGVVAVRVRFHHWRLGVQAIQLSPYRAGLAGRHRTRLPMSPAFPTCSCSLRLSPSGKSMTQKPPFELLLTVAGIQHRVPRRTLSPHPAQHLWSLSMELHEASV